MTKHYQNHYFFSVLKSSCYSDIWKKSNIILAHKTSDKRLVKKS